MSQFSTDLADAIQTVLNSRRGYALTNSEILALVVSIEQVVVNDALFAVSDATIDLQTSPAGEH